MHKSNYYFAFSCKIKMKKAFENNIPDMVDIQCGMYIYAGNHICQPFVCLYCDQYELNK